MYFAFSGCALFQKLMSATPTPANMIRPVRTSSATSCALVNLDTLPNNVRLTLMTAKSNLVSTMLHAKTWWITIPVHARKVTKDSTVKMTLMSAFHRHVSIMPRVSIFLAIIPASVPQDILEICAIQILMNALNSRVRTEGLVGME